MADPRDRVDIDGLRDEPAPPPPAAQGARGPARPFLMIWFRCCNAYGRLNKTTDGLFYDGRCPRCGARCEVPVGEGGTSRRMFEAS
ncbi:MAG: hypothetical protein ACKOYN_11335 [Planctomycetota bacterium]